MYNINQVNFVLLGLPDTKDPQDKKKFKTLPDQFFHNALLNAKALLIEALL